MTERSNVFSMLEDDEAGDSAPTDGETAEKEESHVVMEATTVTEDNDDSSWTVQSSSTTKSRRLVPQWTVTREDLGVEQTRNKVAYEKHEKELKKKLVVRLTKEQLLAVRKPTKILESMNNLQIPNIMSLLPLTPINVENSDADEIAKLWSAAYEQIKAQRKANKENGEARSRRVKPPPGVSHGDEAHNSWSRGQTVDPHADKDGIWDDVAIPEGTVAGRSNEVLFGSKEGTESNSSKTARASGGGPPASSGFDLSDFSAAAMKFQVDTKEIGAGTADGMGGLEDGIEKYDAVGDATMEDLMKEHNDAHNSEAAFNATGNSSMRSKLLETLNIKDKNLDTKEKEPQSDLLMGVDPALIFGPPKSVMDSPAVAPAASEPAPEPPQAPAVAPALAPAEWFYFDPNQVIQGPFDTASMGKWLEAGYFKPDLPVRLKHWQSFYPLGMLFPDPSTAFRTIPPVEPGMLLPPGHPLHVPSNQVTQQQRQQQLLQEQQRQLQEQQRQQRLMQERQQQDQQRHQEQQRILREQQRQQQQLLLEQQQRQLQERQRQQQQLQEQQRLQQLQEQQRQQQLVADMKEQKRLQEQQQQQQQNKILLDQQQRVQNLLMEQQQKQKRAQQPAKAAEKPKQIKKSEKPAAETAKLSPVPAKSNAPATAAAPWADNTTSQPVKAEVSLAEIQKQESQKAQIEAQKRQQLEESRGLKNGQAWGGSKTEKKASIAEIQQREMLEKVKAQQQQKQQQAAGNKNALANKLKMMVGAGNQNQNTPIVASSNWAEGGVQPRIVPAPKPAPSGASLVDIMEQEKKQYSQGVPSQKATAPHSWAAKIGAQGGYTAPAPVAPTPVAPAAAPTPAQSVQQSRSQKKNAPSALPEAAPVTGANGIPQDMVDWCVAQLQRLQKPLDLTLIAFCLSSVDSASEVREYFADYFGSTPQVSQFASEFIKKREKKGRK